MKIAVIGGGLSGCTLARLLKDRGHAVVIFEKNNKLGGLCATDTHRGRVYQLFGPHSFHTKKKAVKKFVLRFSRFSNYIHYVGSCIDGKIVPYPLSYETITLLPERNTIAKEIARLPASPDMSNFETCMRSLLGRTLYEKFIKNYTAKFWGISPKKLSAEWAMKRVEIRKDNDLGYFKKEWQGLPVSGYTPLLEKMTFDLEVRYNSAVNDYKKLKYDLIVSTMPIDELLRFQFGRLQYRSTRFTINFREKHWENEKYGCINFPAADSAYIRKTNYDLVYQAPRSASCIVGYEYPDGEQRTHPFFTVGSKKTLQRYLVSVAKIKNVIPVGRLGLFRYYDMDEAVEWCLNNVGAIERYKDLTFEERMKLLMG